MTVFSSPRANPGIARILYRELARRGRAVERPELLRTVAPPEGYDAAPGNALDETLDVCIGIGVLDFEDGAVAIPPGCPPDAGDDVLSFRALVRTRLFTRAADDPWGGVDRGRDLVCALAWFLDQSPLRPLAWTSVESLLHAQLGFEGRVIGNPAQWRAFVQWAEFLGFVGRLSRARQQGSVAVSLPTVAVRDVVHHALSEGSTGARSFLAALARQLPVIDGGDVRAGLPGAATVAGTVSPSLSLALMSLERAGELQFSNPADAPADTRAVLQVGTESLTVSYVAVPTA